MKKNKNIGSTLESFLEKEGLLEEIRTEALKTTLTLQIKKAMEEQKLTQTELARKMNTSRASIQRLLNPKNTSITLNTLEKVSRLIGKKLQIYFE